MIFQDPLLFVTICLVGQSNHMACNHGQQRSNDKLQDKNTQNQFRMVNSRSRKYYFLYSKWSRLDRLAQNLLMSSVVYSSNQTGFEYRLSVHNYNPFSQFLIIYFENNGTHFKRRDNLDIKLALPFKLHWVREPNPEH